MTDTEAKALPSGGATPLHAAAAAFALCAAVLPGFGDALFSSSWRGVLPSTAGLLLGAALSAGPMAVFAAAVFLDLRRRGVRCGWFRREGFWRETARGAAWALPVFCACAAAAAASSWAFKAAAGAEPPAQNAVLLLSHPGCGAGLRAAVACIAVLAAPLAEELFFRGVMFRGLEKMSSFAFAAFASAFLFAAAHRSAAAFAPLLVFGIVQARLFAKSGSLAAPVAMHAAYNAAGIAAATAFPATDAGAGTVHGAAGALRWILFSA